MMTEREAGLRQIQQYCLTGGTDELRAGVEFLTLTTRMSRFQARDNLQALRQNFVHPMTAEDYAVALDIPPERPDPGDAALQALSDCLDVIGQTLARFLLDLFPFLRRRQ